MNFILNSYKLEWPQRGEKVYFNDTYLKAFKEKPPKLP